MINTRNWKISGYTKREYSADLFNVVCVPVNQLMPFLLTRVLSSNGPDDYGAGKAKWLINIIQLHELLEIWLNGADLADLNMTIDINNKVICNDVIP
jgi:hypothetical protein